MAERLVVSGARGPGLTEIARRTGNFGVAPTDSDVEALTKFADAAIEQNPGFKGEVGDTGAADNTYGTLATFKASDIGRKTASLVGVPGVSDGRFNWTLGNYSAQADDINVIKANSTPLTTGAWVRLGAKGIALPGAPGVISNLADVFADARRIKSYFGARGDAQRVTKPDGTPDEANFTGTDNTTALRDAFGEALDKGFELTLERGSYLISDTLLATIGTDQQQPSIRGAGSALTELIQTNKAKDALRIIGNMPRRDLFAMSGFRVTYPDSWGAGLPTGRAITVENVRSLTMDGIRTFRSALGYNLVGCLDVQMRELVTFYDFVGMKLERGTYDSFPNAISLDRCEIQASYRSGIDIVGGCAITVDGASTIENVGVENTDPTGPLPGGAAGPSGRSIALVLSESGFAGSVAIAGRGLYFEANRDYNIYINHANRAALYKFDACNFNRFNDVRIINDIVFDCPLGNVGTAPAVLDVRGCSFTGFNGYTPDANKRKVAFTLPNGYRGLDFYDDGVLYGEAIERPQVPLAVGHSRPVDVQAFSNDGSLEDSRGVWQIMKVSDGIYRIYPLRGATGLVVTFTRQASAAGGQTLSRISDRTAAYIEVTFETIGTTPVATATSFFVTGSYAQ